MNSSLKIKKILFLVWLPLLMAAKTEIIPEVSLTTDTATTTKAARTEQQITSFDQADLATSPSTDLSELFQQEQSTVRLTNNSGDSSQTALSIRGFGDNAGQNTLILVDGFPLINIS